MATMLSIDKVNILFILIISMNLSKNQLQMRTTQRISSHFVFADPCSSNLPKAFQRSRVSGSLAFLILACLQDQALDAARIKKAYHFRDRLCDSDWIRTNGPHLRRMTLYPAELPNPLFFLGCKFNEK